MNNVAQIVGLLVALFGLLITYFKFKEDQDFRKRADEIVENVVILKSQLYSFFETVKLVTVRFEMEQKNQVEEYKFEDLEIAYKEEITRIHSTLTKMVENGNLILLFNPGEEIFFRLNSLRVWLTSELNEEHPLHSIDGKIVHELTIPFYNLSTANTCLDILSKLDKRALTNRVKEALRDFSKMDDIKEIKRRSTLFKEN